MVPVFPPATTRPPLPPSIKRPRVDSDVMDDVIAHDEPAVVHGHGQGQGQEHEGGDLLNMEAMAAPSVGCMSRCATPCVLAAVSQPPAFTHGVDDCNVLHALQCFFADLWCARVRGMGGGGRGGGVGF